MRKGKIIDGELVKAPAQITVGNKVYYPNSQYYNTLGYKEIIFEDVTKSPFCDYTMTYIDNDTHITATESATIKNDADLAIARKSEIVKKIRSVYDADDVEAILRQQFTKPTEFEAFNEFAENCKEEVDIEIASI